MSDYSCSIAFPGPALTLVRSSDFIIFCNQLASYAGGDILPLNPQRTTDLSDCIALCEEYGEGCVGVSWSEETSECTLKQAMTPFLIREDDAVEPSTNAIRASGPLGLVTYLGISASSALGFVLNNDVTGDLLPPWNTNLPASEALFADLDTILYVSSTSLHSPLANHHMFFSAPPP